MTLERRPGATELAAHATPQGAGLSLDQVIAAWLHAKAQRSKSTKTERAYRDTITAFRAALQGAGLDLDSAPRGVALAAQGWASTGDAAPATFNQRLAILSSFYTYAQRQEAVATNPIQQVERAKAHAYGGAHGLDLADVKRRMKAIDRSTLKGKRDYALLSVALQTGRRIQELASLTWSDLHQAGEKITLTFCRTKGGKTMIDTLPKAVSGAVMTYLYAEHGAQLGSLAPATPLWISAKQRALSTRMIAVLCAEHLGTSKVHSLRHTFAREMEAAGAKVSDIQSRLGHESLATTGRYLAALRQAENPHAEKLSQRFGFDDAP